jgi:hypothetical protein
MLVDPHETLLRGAPKEERDLMIAAGNNGVLGFDNLSHIPDWLSDGLCRIATGAGFGTRQLYSDDEEVYIKACRPILINAIEDIVNRGDLLQRGILLDLPVIPDEQRQTEEKFWRDFDAAHPRLLGALLDSVVRTLATLPGTTLERLPRMADFAL